MPAAVLGFTDVNVLRQTLAGQYRHYVYSIPLTTVATLASVQATTSIESRTDFVCTAVTARALYSAGASINREVDFFVHQMPRLEVIDQGSGASMFDRNDTLFANVWGDALKPHKLAEPHVFLARSVITVIINNISTVGMLVAVAFHGYKQPAKG